MLALREATSQHLNGWFSPRKSGQHKPNSSPQKSHIPAPTDVFYPKPRHPPPTPLFLPQNVLTSTPLRFLSIFIMKTSCFGVASVFFFFRIRHNREALPRGNWVKPTRLGTFYRPAPIRARKWGKTHPFLTKTPSFPPESRSRRGRRETTGLELLCHPDPFFFFFWCGSIF